MSMPTSLHHFILEKSTHIVLSFNSTQAIDQIFVYVIPYKPKFVKIDIY